MDSLSVTTYAADRNQPRVPHLCQGLRALPRNRAAVLFQTVLAIWLCNVPLHALASPEELIPILEESVRLRSSLIKAPEQTITRIEGAGALKLGARGKRVEQLNRRLTELGYLSEPTNGEFSDQTAQAVRAFQADAGIEIDGIVDEVTRFNLNLSTRDKLRLIDAQFSEMERFFNENAGQRFVVVNLPAFTLRAFSNDQRPFESRVVVGQPGRPTPLMNTRLTGIVFHPGWSPPPTILDKDIFRNGGVDARAVKRLGLRLVDDDGKTVPLDSIADKADYAAGDYRFYQPSGDRNALGVLKFDLDNPFNVYLHDTNHRELFAKGARALSSGCIRVDRYRELAAWTLRQTTADIDRQLADRRTRRLSIEPIPVYTVYWQAESTGKRVVYHPDLYHLQKSPPPRMSDRPAQK